MPSFNTAVDLIHTFPGLPKGYSNKLLFPNNNYDSLSALPSYEIGTRNSNHIGLPNGNDDRLGMQEIPSLDLIRESSYNTRNNRLIWQHSNGLNSLFNQTPRGAFQLTGSKPLIGTDRPSALGFENFQNKPKHILGEEYEKILNAKIGDYDIAQINNNIAIR